MRRKIIKKEEAQAETMREPAIEEPSREVSRLLRRWKNTIGNLASGLFPNKNNVELIKRLSENVRALGNREALMVVAKFGDEEAAAKAISRLEIDDIKEISIIPVPDNYRPGFRLAREKLARECPDDFEVQCVLAVNKRPGALEKMQELLRQTEPVEAFLALARHHSLLESVYRDAPGEPMARMLIEAVERVIPIVREGKDEKSEFARETLEEIAIGGMVRQSLLCFITIKALSENPDLVKDERAALAIALRTFCEETRERMLAKLGHGMLAEAYNRGIDKAAEYLERDFNSVHDEKALVCIVRTCERLRILAVRRLDVNSLGELLDYPEARNKAMFHINEINGNFFAEMSRGFGSRSFAIEAARMLDDIENPHALRIIYRNHPYPQVSREALRKLEGMVEKADDQARKDVLRMSFDPEARTKAVRGLDDVHELIYHYRECDYRPTWEAALDRLGELISEDCDEPFAVADIILSGSVDQKALAAAVERMLNILNGDEGSLVVSGRGTRHRQYDLSPETALDILDERAEDLLEALVTIEGGDVFMATALREKLRLALTDWLEECPGKRNLRGIRELSWHLQESQAPLN